MHIVGGFMKDNEEILNNLLQYLNDSFYGLNECAEQAKSTELKNYLMKMAAEREEFISELESIIVLLDGEPIERGTLMGPLHRFYIALKTKISDDTHEAIREEIIRGDTMLIEVYKETLKEETNKDIKAVLTRQVNHVQKNLGKWLEEDDIELTGS